MTASNQFGPSVGRGDVRKWLLGPDPDQPGGGGLTLWVHDYLREAERSQGYPVGQAQAPRSYPVAPDLRKWPEEMIPAVVVQIPGLSEKGTTRGAGGVFESQWIVALSGLVHGRNEADTEALADVYGVALRLLMLQQAGSFVNAPGYTGPPIVVDGVTWDDEGYDDLPWKRSRTLVAATVTFRIDIRGTARVGGPLVPTEDPTIDPGAWPEVTHTELEIEAVAEVEQS